MSRRAKPHPERPVVTRYQLADGRRCKKDTPGARKTTTRSETYFARLVNARTGKREWVSLETTEEGQAWKNLTAKIEERARAEVGLSSPTLRWAALPLEDHLTAWAEQLRNASRSSEEHIQQMLRRLRKLAALARWERLPHITRDSALKALAGLQKERCRGMAAGEHAGRSHQTRNHYTRHLKQFVAWCVREERLERNPVAGVELLNVELDPRHPRRSPSDEDVGRLMDYLEGRLETKPSPRGRKGQRMTGSQRGLGYRVCMATGLRADELRSLDRSSFDLDAGQVRVKAAHSKHRKTDTLDLPGWLVAELREHFAGGGCCWEGFPTQWPGRILLADQEACGIIHRTEEGFFDFHSLRVWYCTWCANRPGISPKTLQTLARHSDPRLTLKVYAKAQRTETKRVIDELPRPGG